MIAGLLLAAAVVPAGQAFVCTPTLVWDGDGPIWCAEGPHVRLAGIAAREIDGSCRLGHPCPKASGIAARDALVRLLGGARGTTRDGHVRVAGSRLSCRAIADSYGRTVARCHSKDVGDVSAAMIRGRTVRIWRWRDSV